MSDSKGRNALPGDNPIREPKDDRLQRTDIAGAFARHVLTLDASEGTAVGVFGPWGSGKTSFINLARESFDEAGIPVLDFNPWLFSGTEQLVERFFVEMSAAMGEQEELTEIGEALRKYGTALNTAASIASTLLAVPQIGEVVKTITETADGAATPESVEAQRKTIQSALEKRDRQIIVVLDDVDRLSGPEIRAVFKLVRLTASFPNLVYIVPCDRPRVEAALEEKNHGLSGSDYLEKIIQWSFNLPEIPIHLLRKQLWASIEGALEGVDESGRLDDQTWLDVRAEIVEPLVRNIRDVRRYAIALRQTVAGLNGEVALVDVLGLEAVRVFLPDVFVRLPGAIESLTFASRSVERRLDRIIKENRAEPTFELNRWLKAQITGLIDGAATDRKSAAIGTAREVTEAMIDRLFPFGARVRRMNDTDSDPYVNEEAADHLAERRVAHEQILRLYLERVIGPELLVFHHAEGTLARMADHGEMDRFIRQLDPAQWQNVVLNLCDLSERFVPAHVEPGILVLLNLWPDMPKRLGSSSQDDARSTVRAATSRLLGTLEDASAVEGVVRRVLPKLKSLSSKLELTLQVSHREKSGSMLVTKTAAEEFESMLQKEIRAASADDLAEERTPSRVMVFARQYVKPPEKAMDIEDSPKLTFALLCDVQGEVTVGSLGSRAVRRTPTLIWERLIDLYGSEDVLWTRIADLKARFEELKPWIEDQEIPLEEAERLLQLADDYIAGLRPGEE